MDQDKRTKAPQMLQESVSLFIKQYKEMILHQTVSVENFHLHGGFYSAGLAFFFIATSA